MTHSIRYLVPAAACLSLVGVVGAETAHRAQKEVSASKKQLDRVNALYAAHAKKFTLGAGMRMSGVMGFQYETNEGNQAKGTVSPSGEIVNMFTASLTDMTQVLSVERLVYDESGTETNRLSATDKQVADLNTILAKAPFDPAKTSISLNAQGGLEYDILRRDGKTVKGTIKLTQTASHKPLR